MGGFDAEVLVERGKELALNYSLQLVPSRNGRQRECSEGWRFEVVEPRAVYTIANSSIAFSVSGTGKGKIRWFRSKAAIPF